MSLFTQMYLPDSYFVSIINSEFISLYVDNFINNYYCPLNFKDSKNVWLER